MTTVWPFQTSLRKEWPGTFAKNDLPKDTPYIRKLRRLNPDPKEDSTVLFVSPYVDETSRGFNALIQYCGGTRVRDLEVQLEKASAWLDDRTHPFYFPASLPPDPLDHSESDIGLQRTLQITTRRYHPGFRSYLQPLTAATLYKHRNEERFHHRTLPDADRRLTFVANPDKYYVLAILETTPQHQHEAFIDFTEKYLAFESSLGVRLSPGGPSTYRFELHLSYFAMMRSEDTNRRYSTAPNRDWIDLSFLSHVLPQSEMEGTLGLHPAQISVVLCGTNETRYMVHCYEDTYFDQDREMGPDEFSSTGLQVDQIAQGDADANFPIWNPHQYFLHILRNRTRQILREWNKVVRTVESGFRTFSSGRIHFAKNSGSPFAHGNLVIASYWTQNMQQVVCKLLHKLIETNETWTAFIALNGDVAYFSNLAHIPLEVKDRIDGMLCHINEDFVTLQCLQRRLSRIQDECEKLEKFLEVRLLVEGSKNTEMTILYICPVTIVCTFFAIPTPIMSFQRNGQSFCVAIIVVTAVFYILQSFAGGRLRQQPWWATIVARTKLAWRGDRTNTIRDEASGRLVLRRRRTHPWSKVPKDS